MSRVVGNAIGQLLKKHKGGKIQVQIQNKNANTNTDTNTNRHDSSCRMEERVSGWHLANVMSNK